MNLGNVALAFAFASGIAALQAYFFWARGHADLRPYARGLNAGLAAGVVIASAFQMRNILTHQFQYEYVASFSDRSLPTLLLFSTFWGGQAGSFLLWALWSVLFGLILMWGLRRSSWEPFVLTPYLLVTLCITALTWATGPFNMLPEPPVDGNGLNPLLQNYWMAIHPPILFTGFTTMAGPFAFAVAALWKRDYDGWVRLSRPWTILAWACMGSGLALGGFWAYESLGWGGFWGWDPVENSSLVPWLFASALLHGLIMQGARGSFKRSNLLLAITGYLTVIYSTFLTRSGILGEFSVHSFVELGLMGYLVVFIVIFAVLGFGMLLWHWRRIGWRVLYSHALSREFGLVLSVALFVGIALIVSIGTSMPVISLLPFFERQMSVEMAWYGPTIAPLGLLLLLTMAIGPLLGWQRSKYGSLARVLKWPALVTGITIFVCLLLNIVYPLALLFVAAAVFAAATNAVVIARIWRAGPLKLGGYLCHIGVGLLFVGIVGTSLYKQTAALQLVQDTPQSVFGRQFTFRGIAVPPDDPLGREALEIEVTDPQNGDTWLAHTPYYVYQKSGTLVTHPDIKSGWWSDLYLAPSQYLPAAQLEPGVLLMGRERALEIADYTLTFQKFELPDREAMMRGEGPVTVEAVMHVVAPDGTTTTVKPTLQVETDKSPVSEPIALPGGATAALVQVDAGNQLAVVQIGGVDLSTVNPDDLKGRAFVEVSHEPGIKLVWAGIIIAVLGGVLALMRRWREARPTADVPSGQVPAPAPHRNRPVLQPETPFAQTISNGEVPNGNGI
jgi:cytochrome c-type biogenesis protein CcmF